MEFVSLSLYNTNESDNLTHEASETENIKKIFSFGAIQVYLQELSHKEGQIMILMVADGLDLHVHNSEYNTDKK